MKMIMLCLSLCVGVIVVPANDRNIRPDKPQRRPYKEVRTKHNQDPAVRDTLRKKIEAEHKQRAEERKKLEAQRLKPGATNRVSVSQKPTNAPAASIPQHKRP